MPLGGSIKSNFVVLHIGGRGLVTPISATAYPSLLPIPITYCISQGHTLRQPAGSIETVVV